MTPASLPTVDWPMPTRRLGKSADAENTYRRAIEMRKDYWGGYSALGSFYANRARYEELPRNFNE